MALARAKSTPQSPVAAGTNARISVGRPALAEARVSDRWRLLLVWLALLIVPFIAPNSYVVSLVNMMLINVILIGSRKSNPWDDLFEGNLNFTIGSDLQSGQSFVINKHPVGQEPSRYDGHLELPIKISYSVIAFVPNLNRTGYALVIEGTDSQATNAAGQFMTSEKSLASLKRRLPAGPFPYFEVVMKSLRLNKTPFSSEIVAVQVYPGPTLP